MEEKRIIEIDGVKIEVDMRTAKRIDTFKVGDNVKVLCKDGSDFKVRPGVIIDFCNFKEKPTISVAVYKEPSYYGGKPGIEIINIFEGMEDKYEIVYTSEEDIRLTRDGIIERFEHEIQKKREEMLDLENQLSYFKKHFLRVGLGEENKEREDD